MKKNIILTLVTATVLTLVSSVNTEAKTKAVSLDSAAKKYVTTANSSANKKSGKTKVTIVVKGKVTRGKFGAAVANIRCKNVRKGTKDAFKDEMLCPLWSDLEKKYSSKTKATTFTVEFNNKKMNQFSSYGKTNWIEKAEKKVDSELAVFKKAFGEDVMKQKSQLGAFAVSYVHAKGGCGGNGGYYNRGWVGSCAKGVTGVGPGCNCSGKLNAVVRVMHILGFSYDDCGGIFNYATNHGWNWWKDEDGKLYMGDATCGTGFDGDMNDINEYGSFIGDDFMLYQCDQLDYFGYTDADKMKAELSLEQRFVPFSVYNKYCPVKGFGNCTKQAWVDSVKAGDNGYASDGEKGTNWKYSKIKFVY